MASVQIYASWGNGKTLDKFSQILQQRMKYMNETARDSVAACAINALRGIRTVTKVAKPSSIKVDVEPVSTLYPSFTTQGHNRRFCLRMRGSNEKYTGDGILTSSTPKVDTKLCRVFKFYDAYAKKPKTYLIVAPTIGDAKNKAKQIVRSRQMRYSGLAKRAISILMMRTSTKTVADNVPMQVTRKARELTSSREIIAKGSGKDGGKYSLVLDDNLRYALAAIKGGQVAVDTQLKKAMNKIVSVINQKIKKNGGLFGDGKLDTPFPEVRQRKQ